jgi:hypothetical protein
MSLVTADYLRYHTPSRAKHISYAEELRLRKDTILFLAALGKACDIGSLAVATASVYCHTFFLKLDFQTETNKSGHDRYEVAAACLFLAGKVEEKLRRVNDVVRHCFMVRFPGKRPLADDDEELINFRRRLYQKETLLLDVVEYNFRIQHPYSLLPSYFTQLLGPTYGNISNDTEWNKGLMVKGGLYQIAFYFVNDSFRSTACLQYPADTVAVAVVRMALKHKGIEIVKCKTLRDMEEAEAAAKGLPPPPQRPWFEELYNKDKLVLDAIATLIAHVLDGADPVDHEAHVMPPQVVSAQQAMAERVERRRRNLSSSSSATADVVETKSTSPNKRPREDSRKRVCSILPDVPPAAVFASNSVLSSCTQKDDSDSVMDPPPMKLARLSKDVPSVFPVLDDSFPEVVKIQERKPLDLCFSYAEG